MLDGRSNQVRILRRSDLTHIGNFGYGGRLAGGLTTPHNLSVDSHGNLYVTESGEGKRVQRFLYTGLGPARLPCTSARAEVTASGAGRVCDEESFVGSAALGCIKVPSGAGKTEIPVNTVHWVPVELFRVR